ncbi:hypothetical protein [Lactococcus lactis]|uniref:Uncharacterized protein n=1 Tax=Lactococcus lactis TaxID=1358 RepID=A0AB35KFR4_9LACT|nr:hypothetical protein [Lactococcus lactis]MDG4980005.1 hypothetical protein [Lactococcus lactis]MDG5049980.1 hypothetical protein [Lactococcus lactis]
MKNEILEQTGEIILSNSKKAILIQNQNISFNNISIVELDEVFTSD